MIMHIAYEGVERRRSQRVSYSVEVWYRDRNKKTQGFKHGYSKNISQHGLLFETYENFPSCTILELKLGFPPLPGFSLQDAGSFMLLGEVVRTEEIMKSWLYQLGISFCKIEEKDRNFLVNYVTRVLELSEQNELACPVPSSKPVV